MKRNYFCNGLATCLLSLSALIAPAQEKGSLTVELEGLRNNDGRVMIALTKEAIPADMNFIATKMVPADTTGLKLYFNDLPETTIYVQAFHDENGNFKLETSPEGIPQEGVGSIKDSRKRPSVNMVNGPQEIKIHMIYF